MPLDLSEMMNEKRFHDIEENVKRIFHNTGEAAVKSGRKPEDITVMAATKTVPAVLINHAIRCGITDIGENRVQEFLQKNDNLMPDVKKHMIGSLQTNKVRKIVGKVDLIQSLNSVPLAKEIDIQSKKCGVITKCLIEINIGSEYSKSGAEPDTLPAFLEEMSAFDNIRISGLMAIPPFCENPDQSRRYFADIMKIFLDIASKKYDNVSMDILSMGMSSDYCEAVLEGATMIRPGSLVFGKRQ